MKQFSCLMLFLILSYSGYGYEERNLLEKQADVTRLKEILIPNQKWVSYPKYTDREGWDALTKEHKQMLIRRGEKQLNYEWKVIKATDYLEYERTGNRKLWKTLIAVIIMRLQIWQLLNWLKEKAVLSIN